MSSLPAPSVGTLLKRYRRAAGLTQEALAEQAGISADTVSELERGVNLRPRTDTLDRLADALGLAPTERAQLQAAARGLARRSGWRSSNAARIAGPCSAAGMKSRRRQAMISEVRPRAFNCGTAPSA